jgi:hypothetical protein
LFAFEILAAKKQTNIDKLWHSWEVPSITATVIDSRRRLVMPPELPARSASPSNKSTKTLGS